MASLAGFLPGPTLPALHTRRSAKGIQLVARGSSGEDATVRSGQRPARTGVARRTLLRNAALVGVATLAGNRAATPLATRPASAPPALAAPPAAAAARPEPVDRPDLLPQTYSTVIDLENFLASGEERRLRERLADLETRTAFKLRVLTQRYPETPGRAIKAYWDVDERTVVLVADYFAGGGSLLHFTVGEEVAAILPPRFWSVLTSSLGNRFYVSKNGEGSAILGAVDAIRTCLLAKGCAVPPQDAAFVLQR
jgi:hypothetical protein